MGNSLYSLGSCCKSKMIQNKKFKQKTNGRSRRKETGKEQTKMSIVGYPQILELWGVVIFFFPCYTLSIYTTMNRHHL